LPEASDLEIRIKVKRIHPNAKLPVRGSQLSAGADVCCLDAFTLQPGERKAVPTGLTIETPPGWYARVAPRSGLAARHGVDTLAGVVDSDYRGELIVVIINLGAEAVSFNAGDRIAQLIIERAALCDYFWENDLSETGRGEGGFGSTGR
jgi:dUTP pyrophosphatase